jgi:poly-beta-hydroxybutyrate-responsive repressor
LGGFAVGECEPRNFLQPCLLLLLRERSDHGYDLVNRLRVLHAVDGDAGAVYRALRGLEKAGMVRSSWQTSEAGPARRTYQVTSLGVATLDRQVDVLEETHRTLHLFRERYARLDTGAAHHTDNCIVPDGFGPHGEVVIGDGFHNGAARNRAGHNGAAQSGAAKNGAAQNGAAKNGAAKNGAAKNGAAQNGAGQNGAAKGGAAENGAGRNGAGLAHERGNGDGGGPSGGAHSGPGGRGIRPPQLPGQRSGG